MPGEGRRTTQIVMRVSSASQEILREELTLLEGSHGGLRCVLQKIAAGRPQGDIGGTAALSHHAFGNRHHGLLVPDLRHHRVMGFNAACIEACSLSWPFPSPGHPVKD